MKRNKEDDSLLVVSILVVLGTTSGPTRATLPLVAVNQAKSEIRFLRAVPQVALIYTENWLCHCAFSPLPYHSEPRSAAGQFLGESRVGFSPIKTTCQPANRGSSRQYPPPPPRSYPYPPCRPPFQETESCQLHSMTLVHIGDESGTQQISLIPGEEVVFCSSHPKRCRCISKFYLPKNWLLTLAT